MYVKEASLQDRQGLQRPPCPSQQSTGMKDWYSMSEKYLRNRLVIVHTKSAPASILSVKGIKFL